MKTSARIAATLALSGAALAAALPASAAPAAAPGGVVFVQTNDPAGNAVAVYARQADGTLAAAGRYPTGGRGGALGGAKVDRLASQGSLAYDAARHRLYVVNAGSDTITVFAVAGDHLIRVQEVASGGDFPVSLTVHGGQVFVLNSRDGGSVQGFADLAGFLAPVPSWHRALHLTENPAGDPGEFTSTPGQVGVTPDGRQLLVTTKSSDTIEAFALGRTGTPSATPVITADPGNSPYSFGFDPAGHLVVTESGPSALATFAVRSDGTLSPLDRQVTGQAATCWVSADGTGFYTSNAGSGTLSQFITARDGRLTAHGTASTDAGVVDSAVTGDGRFLYAQSGGAGTVDEFRVGADHTLTPLGSVTVPDTTGGEGIAAS